MTKTIKTLIIILVETLVFVPFTVLTTLNIMYPNGPETLTVYRVITIIYMIANIILIPGLSLWLFDLEDRQLVGCAYFLSITFGTALLWFTASERKFFGTYSPSAHHDVKTFWFYMLFVYSWIYPLMIGIMLLINQKSWKSRPEAIARKTAENASAESFLLELAENDESRQVRETAFNRLTRPESFEHILIFGKYPDIRAHATEKINDQKILLQAAEKDEAEEVRAAAVQRINDADVLARIVKDDPSSEIRVRAMRRVTDHKVLAWVIENDKNDSIRKEAYEKAGDPELLAQILTRHPDYMIWPEAVAIVTEQSLLEQISKNDKNWRVREAAVKRIENRDILAEISIEDNESSIRRTARMKTGPDEIINAAQNSDAQALWMPVELVRQIGDEKTLKKIAARDQQYEVRTAAVKKISDPIFLAGVAQSDSSPSVREEAVRKVSDRMILRRIIQNDRSMDVLRVAISRTPDIDMKIFGWEKVLNNDPHDKAAADALRNLYLENHISKQIETVNDHSDYEDSQGVYCCYSDYSDHSDTKYYVSKN